MKAPPSEKVINVALEKLLERNNTERTAPTSSSAGSRRVHGTSGSSGESGSSGDQPATPQPLLNFHDGRSSVVGVLFNSRQGSGSKRIPAFTLSTGESAGVSSGSSGASGDSSSWKASTRSDAQPEIVGVLLRLPPGGGTVRIVPPRRHKHGGSSASSGGSGGSGSGSPGDQMSGATIDLALEYLPGGPESSDSAGSGSASSGERAEAGSSANGSRSSGRSGYKSGSSGDQNAPSPKSGWQDDAPSLQYHEVRVHSLVRAQPLGGIRFVATPIPAVEEVENQPVAPGLRVAQGNRLASPLPPGLITDPEAVAVAVTQPTVRPGQFERQSRPAKSSEDPKKEKDLAAVSKGSAQHPFNRCTPCRFFHTRRGCWRGKSCGMCHLPHPDAPPAAPRQKQTAARRRPMETRCEHGGTDGLFDEITLL